MIRAQTRSPWKPILRRYTRRLCATRFSGIYAHGLQNLASLEPDRPVLAIANHTNWWDGFMAGLLSARLPSRHPYCMMEERQLRHYRFLSHIGAFSVDLDSPARAAAAVRYAMRLLADPASLLWIFPQGNLESPYVPIRMRPGAAFLARKTPGIQILPVIFRYAFFHEDRPHALIGIGTPAAARPDTTDQTILALLEATRETLDPLVVSRELPAFDLLLPPGLSLNKRWEWLRRAATGRLRDFTPHNG